MKGKVNCTCGWSWNKSDSSAKDMYICHECGRDNSNNMKNGGWLDNYNDSQASAPEGMVGDGYSNVGRNYSPTWGGQFQMGGKLKSNIPVIEDVGDYNEEGYWVPDWEAMTAQAKKLGAKKVKTKHGSLIVFDDNWEVIGVDDNPDAMQMGGNIYPVNYVPQAQDGEALYTPPKSQYKRLYGHATDYSQGENPKLRIDPNTGYGYFPPELSTVQQKEVPDSPWNVSRFLFDPLVLNASQGVHNAKYDKEGNIINIPGKDVYEEGHLLPIDSSRAERYDAAKNDITNYYKEDVKLSDDEVEKKVDDTMDLIRKMRRTEEMMQRHNASYTDFQNPEEVFRSAVGFNELSPIDSMMEDKNLSPAQAKRAYKMFQKTWRGTSGKEARQNSREELKKAQEAFELAKEQMKEDLPQPDPNYVPEDFANGGILKNGGWLDSYADGGTMQEHQENYNDYKVSAPEGFKGNGYSNVGRNYSPAWGGQFQDGGIMFKSPSIVENDIDYNDYTYSYPEREPYSSELEFFKTRPDVGGMATEDNHVIINPYSPLSDEEKEAVRMNEVARLAMRNGYARPTFDLTPEQQEFFNTMNNGKPYSTDEQDIRETIIGRILSGDDSAKNVTPEQKKYAEELQSVLERSKDYATGMSGMMKSKIATEAHYGNPAALRMVSPNPNKYTFTGEEKDWKGNQASPAGFYGTHFMGSFGNQARPGLQEVNGKMQYFQDPPRNSKENFNFSRPEDAEYFAKHYKEVAPMSTTFRDLNSFQGGGSIPGATGSMYARIGAPSNGPYAKKTMASAQNGVDMYDNPMLARRVDNTNIDRSYYDPRLNTMNIGSDYNMWHDEETGELLTGDDLKYHQDKMLAHENYHAIQHSEDRDNYDIAHDTDNAQWAQMQKRPELMSTNAVWNNFYNRSDIENQQDYQDMINYFPESRILNEDLLFDKVLDGARYNNPSNAEGEAKFYEDTGVGFRNGGWLDGYDKAQGGTKVEYGTPEYEEAYNKGEVVTDEGGRSPILLDEVVIPAKPLTEFGKTRKEIAAKNTWEQFGQRFLGNFEKNMGQTLENLPEYRKKEYEDYVNKLAFDEYIKTHPQAKGEDRGAYIDRMQAENANSSNFERAYEANADYNDATDVNKWRKGLIGLGTAILPAPAMSYMKQNSDYFSKKEKQAMIDNPISTQVGDVLGTIEPLTIPVEGLYSRDKSFGQIASGESADIPMSARILGDPMMLAFEAAPLIGSGFRTAGRLLGTEEGLLSNAYKYNPYAKGNKFNSWNPDNYYRAGDKRVFLDDVLNSNKIRVYNENSYANLRNAGKISGVRENGKITLKAKDFPEADAYFAKGRPLDGIGEGIQKYGDHVIEVSNDTPFIHAVNQRTKQPGFWDNPDFNYNDTHVTGNYVKPRQSYGYNAEGKLQGSIGTPLEYDPNTMKLWEPHWLKGYQQIETPTPSLGSSVDNVTPTFKSEIDWSKWNKEIPENTQLMDEYSAIEQTTKANGSWMKNPDGSAFQGTPEQFIQQNSENFKKAFGNTKVRDPKGNIQITNHSTWDKFDEFDLNKFGQTDQGFYGKGVYFHPNTNSPKLYGDIDMNSYVNIENPMPHDTHFFFGREGKGRYWDSVKNEQVQIDDLGSLWKGKYDGYITNHAGPPFNDFNSTEYITNIPSNIKSAIGNNGMFDMTNPNIYKSVLPIGLGLGAASQLEQKREGGIIKDDRGQWDHPGEITRISGGNITMKRDPKTGKALTQPILGIADTGEEQWMYPGEDYNFEGANYVTEYPKGKKPRMAKNGLRQEQKGLVNLDNLLNFTNYNKPQPGGWLDNY